MQPLTTATLSQITGEVSILTRPGGRVQPTAKATSSGFCEFQSSPVPEDGCNLLDLLLVIAVQMVSILTRPGGRVQRPEEAESIPPLDAGFNPHPSRRTGATNKERIRQLLTFVSILTRPGGRVQRPRQSV